ncbi:hypothetical protein PENSPDRAFT_685162 [Peniophora sp. CONT]|nr:hypothetical protein PENSPDRAFT_685162 [Peniophora sp. CONT]
MLGPTLFWVACPLLIHSAYSSYEHLSHLKAVGRLEGSLPLDIAAEALLAMILGIVGSCLKLPESKDITWAGEMKTRSIDDADSRLSFANYTTRGRVLTEKEKSA